MPRGKKSKGMKWSALTHNQHTARSPRLQNLLHLCEASKHGFPHGVFVGICSRNTIGAALGSQASASHSHLGLEGKRHGMSFGVQGSTEHACHTGFNTLTQGILQRPTPGDQTGHKPHSCWLKPSHPTPKWEGRNSSQQSNTERDVQAQRHWPAAPRRGCCPRGRHRPFSLHRGQLHHGMKQRSSGQHGVFHRTSAANASESKSTRAN